MMININEISKEIQDILAKYEITMDLIDTVLEQCSKDIKSRTEIKAIQS